MCLALAAASCVCKVISLMEKAVSPGLHHLQVGGNKHPHHISQTPCPASGPPPRHTGRNSSFSAACELFQGRTASPKSLSQHRCCQYPPPPPHQSDPPSSLLSSPISPAQHPQVKGHVLVSVLGGVMLSTGAAAAAVDCRA